MNALLVHDLGGLALGASLCAAGLTLAEALRRFTRAGPEATRKCAHASTGLAAACFPWLFNSPVSVGLLCGGFLALLAWSRAVGRLASIHGVARRSEGSLYYPFGVALVFLLARGRPAVYVSSLLVLAVSDAAAALLGARGVHRYDGPGGPKSLEGSLAFFASALPCILVPLAWAVPSGRYAACGLAAAALATVLEATSPKGSDNLTVPFGTCLFLRAWS